MNASLPWALCFMVLITGCADNPDDAEAPIEPAQPERHVPASLASPDEGKSPSAAMAMNVTATLSDCLIDVQTYPVTDESLRPHVPAGYDYAPTYGYAFLQWRAWQCEDGEIGRAGTDQIFLGVAYVILQQHGSYLIEAYTDSSSLGGLLSDLGFNILVGDVSIDEDIGRTIGFSAADEPWFTMSVWGASPTDYEEPEPPHNMSFNAYVNDTFVRIAGVEQTAPGVGSDEAAVRIQADRGLFTELQGPAHELVGGSSSPAGSIVFTIPVLVPPDPR